MRIQHNITAMNAYRNYSNNTSAINKNLEKLSSGYKINRAGDDAAGLAVSQKMRLQISGLSQAQKNAKSGISYVQTAEGALQEVHEMLERMYTLTEQSANGTFDSTTDRTQLQKEVNSLMEEINRIGKTANFNGQGIFKQYEGATSTAAASSNYQVTDNASSAVNALGLEDFSISGLPSDVKSVKIVTTINSDTNGNGSATANLTDGVLTINVVGKDGTGTEVTADNIKTAVTDIDALKDAEVSVTIGSTITAGTVELTPAAPAYAKGDTFTLDLSKVDVSGLADDETIVIGDTSFKIKNGTTETNGTELDIDPSADSASELADVLAAAIGANAGTKDLYTAEAKDGVITLTAKADAAAGAKAPALGATGTADLGDAKIVADSDSSSEGPGSVSFWVGAENIGEGANKLDINTMSLEVGDLSIGASYNNVGVNVDSNVSKGDIENLDITTADRAMGWLNAIKDASNSVSNMRGTLGAMQNRLEHTIKNLSVMQENMQDAESVIRDTDVAEEMMAYTKNNILVQSAQAMLAQANQLPQGVLQLLG